MVAFLGLDTPFKWGIFMTYMGLWTGLRIIIYASQQGSSYNTAAVVRSPPSPPLPSPPHPILTVSTLGVVY